jgi:DNA polymerase-1
MGYKVKVNVAVDADYLTHQIIHRNDVGTRQFSDDGDVIDDGYKQKVKPLIKEFKLAMRDLKLDMQYEFKKDYKIGKVVPFFTSPDNFRHRLTDTYKIKRPSRSELHLRFIKKLRKLYPDSFIPNVEADDVVAYYVREKGWIGASFDKDLLRGVPGSWFDVYHARRERVQTCIFDANRFVLIQTIMGDTTDDIQGIKGVGEKTAIKLLDKYGWSWGGVVKAYEQYGMTEKDAILTRRLVGLDQWTPETGVVLFRSR